MRSPQTSILAPTARRPVRRSTRRFGVLLLATGVLALGALPAGADPTADNQGPVSRFTAPFALAYIDPADNLVALGGPPPEQGCLDEGFEDHKADFQEVQLPSGPVVALVRDIDQPMRLYQASSVDEICDAVAAGEDPQPIATGTAHVVATTNDAFGSGRRTTTLGDKATGTLLDSAGKPCHFTGIFREQISPAGESRIIRHDIQSTC
jgi:hypothetical protein